jgi:hypothetical protein
MTTPVAVHSGPYAGSTLHLPTRHEKERVLAPLCAARLGATLVVVADLDTDALGTFTREIPRPSDQLETARRKAMLALERTGGQLGLGSEGAFGPGPYGLATWNVELLVFIDRTRSIEVIGTASGPGLHVHGLVRERSELDLLIARAGFPDHGVVVRPDGPSDPRITKGIRSRAALDEAFDAARRSSSSGAVFVENDLRAHMHPSRMAMIERAGIDLFDRLARCCPACGSPGFGRVGSIPGLPCSSCGMPTNEPAADVDGCVRCGHRVETRRPTDVGADPSRCPYCNP